MMIRHRSADPSRAEPPMFTIAVPPTTIAITRPAQMLAGSLPTNRRLSRSKLRVGIEDGPVP